MRRFFICLVAILQLLLSISPFLPYVRDNIWAPQTSVSGFAAALATYVGIQFVFLSGLVYLLLEDFKEQAISKLTGVGSLLQKYTPLHVRQLKENEFYKDFLGSCVRAQHYVQICYFSPRPPAVGGSKERNEYYANIAAVMRNNPETQFRRIVRDTPANREWVIELSRTLVGTTNSSIALLEDRDDSVEMPLALSVQIVDGYIAWLVALGEHAGAPVYRDIAIENTEVVSMLNKYFDRLWALSRVVFEAGFDEAKTLRSVSGENRWQ